MTWKINNTRVYVTGFSISPKPVVAKLQPFGDKSIYHKFGRESPTIQLEGYIAGISKRDTLMALSYNTSPTGVVLTTPFETISGLICGSVELSMTNAIYQTFDQDASCTDPVYQFRIEFWKDENV